ncbi:MAG: hypothetical protein WD509_00070 [Candidatus Paceibacterota bacterium]
MKNTDLRLSSLALVAMLTLNGCGYTHLEKQRNDDVITFTGTEILNLFQDRVVESPGFRCNKVPECFLISP